MEDQQQLKIADDFICLHSCWIFSGHVSQSVFYAGWDKGQYGSMDKNNYLHSIHFSCLSVIVVGLWFPAWAVCFFLGEGEETIQCNCKAV